MSIEALLWVLVLPISRAEANGPPGEEWPLGRAAMEIRRLPRSGTTADDELGETSDSPAAFCALPVSTDAWLGSGDEDPWSGSPTRLYLGYDRGFVIAADQAVGEDAPRLDFLLRVNSWSQLRHTLFESDGPNPDQNSFSFERLRLSFAGHVFAPDLQYFFQFDGNSDRSTQTIFLDYFVTYDLGQGILGCEENRLGIKFGKWKVPFSRSREESGRLLQFADRASANVLFDVNRSFGAGLYGRLDTCPWPVHYETAVFNGLRTGSVSTTRSDGELDTNFAWSLRSHTDLFGDFGTDGEPDLSWHALPALRLGGGLAFTRVDDQGTREFSRQSVVDSGATLASLLPAGVSAYDVWLYTVDAQLKYHGFSLIADYYWRYITQFSGGSVPSLYDTGWVFQSGYFVLPEKLELLIRWSRIAGDSGTLGLCTQSSDEVAAGLAWYIKGHHAKLVFDATHHNGAPIGDSRLDTLPGDVGWLFRTQFQLAF